MTITVTVLFLSVYKESKSEISRFLLMCQSNIYMNNDSSRSIFKETKLTIATFFLKEYIFVVHLPINF